MMKIALATFVSPSEMRNRTWNQHCKGKGGSCGDMVKCELRVANASCELLIFCELRVTSCSYCASYELRVAIIMRVASCELNERCELETQKCELKPKVRVACFLL